MVLTTAINTGVLSFSTSPPGANIIIDDQPYDLKTPTAINNIPPGSHTYTLKLEGYKDFTDSADVVDGRLCCIEVNLDTVEEKGACNPTPIVQVPAPTKPDYSMLVVGLIIGAILVSILKREQK